MSLVFRDLADGKELGVFITCVFYLEQTDHNFTGFLFLK